MSGTPRLVSTAAAPKKGHVYFVGAKDTKRIKIGFTSTTPKARIASIQSNSAEQIIFLYSIEADQAFERALHRTFKAYRFRGEWFSWNEPLVAFVEEASIDLQAALKYHRVRWKPAA